MSLAIPCTIKLYFYDRNLDENRSKLLCEKINTIFKKVLPAVFGLKLTDSQVIVQHVLKFSCFRVAMQIIKTRTTNSSTCKEMQQTGEVQNFCENFEGNHGRKEITFKSLGRIIL